MLSYSENQVFISPGVQTVPGRDEQDGRMDGQNYCS